MVIDSSLDSNAMQSAFYVAGSLGILISTPVLCERYKNWQDKRKAERAGLTKYEKIFKMGCKLIMKS